MEIEPEVIDCMNDIIKKIVHRESNRKYRENNKDKMKQYRESIKDKFKEYCTTPEFIKTKRICDWKRRGVICDDFDALYNHYLKTSYCDFCRCELSIDKVRTVNTKCLDHDHSITDRPNFRNILCHSCNVKRR